MVIIMKTAKWFLFGIYAHLILTIAIPAGIIFLDFNGGYFPESEWLLTCYLLTIAVVLAFGWVCVLMAVAAYRKGSYEKIRSGFRLLKFGAIPFYMIYFFFVFFIAEFPLLIIGTMIIQSGCVGVCYIMYLRKQTESYGRPSGIHYMMQFLGIFDLISAAIILNKYKPE